MFDLLVNPLTKHIVLGFSETRIMAPFGSRVRDAMIAMLQHMIVDLELLRNSFKVSNTVFR